MAAYYLFFSFDYLETSVLELLQTE